MNQIPRIPDEYIGKILKGNGVSKTDTRRWTKLEEKWCMNLKAKGFDYDEIAISVGRSRESVSIKIKRLMKLNKSYNSTHLKDKRKTNIEFLEKIKPATVLDLYCGDNHCYEKYNVIRNDIDKNYEAEYHMDALKLLCKLYIDGRTFDMIDIDPFGSAYDCFDLAIKIAKKGIAITLGEMGHKRFKRLDFVRTHYGINKLEDFTVENIIKHIQIIGKRNKKLLRVWKIKKWRNIVRVYFIIEEYKIKEQWERGE